MATSTTNETRSFTDAFISKYSQLVDEDVTTPQVMSFQEGKDRVVEFVGVDKVAQKISKNLREVSVRGLQINRPGQFTDEIKHQIKDVTILDISNNLFESWIPIANIVACFPSLTRLIVSDNPQLQFPSDLPLKEVLQYKQYFKNVKSIVFGNSDQSWFGITYCALQMWSRELESLEVFRNGMTELTTPPPNCYYQLKHLGLSGNPITEWSEICKLAILPNLKELILSDCQIDSIFLESIDGKTNLFPVLETLSLAGNQLKSWRDIAELNKLKSLKVLNVKNNPVTAVNAIEDYESIVNLIISRVSGLTKVNNEEISESTEKEAAKYYVKKYYLDYHNRTPDCEWHLHHPRWSELIEMVGEPIEHAQKVKSKHVSLVFKHADGNSQKKKLPESTTVSNVKAMVKKMFGMNEDKDVKLVWKTNKEDDEFEYPLEDDEHPLSYYSVDDNDVIHVTQ